MDDSELERLSLDLESDRVEAAPGALGFAVTGELGLI